MLSLSPFWFVSYAYWRCCTRIDAVVQQITEVLIGHSGYQNCLVFVELIIVFSKSKSENLHRERTPFPVSFHWFFVGFYLVPPMSECQFPSGKHLLPNIHARSCSLLLTMLLLVLLQEVLQLSDSHRFIKRSNQHRQKELDFIKNELQQIR